MVLTVGHTKGGVGKSTLALNIAIERTRAGRETLLIDGDPRQASVSKAIGIRGEAGAQPAITCIMLEEVRSLRQQVGMLRSKFQDIVIDVGGKDSSALRAALMVTDALLLPIAPESVEVWAIDDMVELIDEARSLRDVRVLAVLNRAKSAGRDNEETLAVVREYPGLELLPGAMGSRAVFSNAFGRGLSVAEFRPGNPKARAEVACLMQALYGD
jgi:chromosome partitioning protein